MGMEGMGRALLVGDLGWADAVPAHLGSAEFHLLAVDGEVLLDLDDEVGVGQPYPIAGGGPKHVGIDGTFYLGAQSVLLARSTVSSNVRSSTALTPRHPSTTCSAHPPQSTKSPRAPCLAPG